MKHNNVHKTVVITIIISFFLIPYSLASEGGDVINLEPTKEHPSAIGTAVIDKNHVSIQARGLKPDSVYTVWFVNPKPKKHVAGVGSAPYMFRTDKWGDGNYTSELAEAPFGKWAMVMVVLHPDGNPKDMKHMVGALRAKL